MAQDDLKDAVMRELYAAGAAERVVDMTLIGPPLVAAGYDVHRIAFAIESLVRDKRIDFAGSNGLRIIENPD